ncbi:TPA: hypothetical protein ACKL4B_002091, partial [Neisseria gonorrhoeae]
SGRLGYSQSVLPAFPLKFGALRGDIPQAPPSFLRLPPPMPSETRRRRTDWFAGNASPALPHSAPSRISQKRAPACPVGF